jgi:TrmH family RNA methyltransferase
MISKAQAKLIHSLRLPKNRESEGLFVVEGVKMVDELLASNLDVVSVYATKEWVSPVDVDVSWVEDWELQKISSLTTANQVLAVARIPERELPVNTTGELVIMLDKVSDPGNLGTIIRTAEWFGIDRVIASLDSVDCWNAKVVQASMGSIFRVPVHYVDLVTFLTRAKAAKVPVYGTLFDGEVLGSTALTKNGVIIVGNESKGISTEVQKHVTRKLTIKPSTVSSSESLNVSMATSIVCYEFRRQFPR